MTCDNAENKTYQFTLWNVTATDITDQKTILF